MFSNQYDLSNRSTIPHRGVVTTAQIDWELKQLITIYDELNPAHVLEVGSQFGGTLYYWLTGADDGATVVNIDILQNMTDRDREELPGRWRTWVPYGVNYHSVIGRSDDPDTIQTALSLLDHQIDFLFIDALHTYEGSKNDFCTYGQYVRPGGIIALHDIITPDFAPHIQVEKLWREIQRAGYKTQEIVAGSSYGGIGVVFI